MGSRKVGTVGLANGGRGERAVSSKCGWSGLICTPELLVLTVLVTVVLAWSSHHLSPVGPPERPGPGLLGEGLWFRSTLFGI